MSADSVRLPRVLALGTAMAAGAVGFSALASAPEANATCASFFGIGNSANCTSTLTTVAFAFGEDAQAHAGGVLGAAISFGNSSSATTAGFGNLAVNNGNGSSAYVGGNFSTAIGWGVNDATVSAGTGGQGANNWWNAAIAFGARSDETTNVTVNGIANLGVNFIGSGDIDAEGTGTVTVNALGGLNNLVNHGNLSNVSSFISANTTINNTGTLSWAWDVVGATNTVETTGGFSVAGALFQENETVVQNGPGVNLRLRPTVGSSARPNAKPAAATAGPAAANDKPESASAGSSKRGAAGHGTKNRNRD